jgi:16S rRNA (cytidine1402-2'-O)-methyltransferase
MVSFIPTPIGNLSDITFRSLELFSQAELFFCEDTRVTKRLIRLLEERYGLQMMKEPIFVSFHEHNGEERLERYAREIGTKSCVYVSDAGMPAISDPGRLLVAYCQKHEIPYQVLPGASAVTTAYAASGFASGKFAFYAFLPHKGEERTAMLHEVLASSVDVVLYESPHRLLKLLESIAATEPMRVLFLAKELTKAHETYYKGDARTLYESLKNEHIRGEWCIVIEASEKKEPVLSLRDIESMDMPPKVKAKLLSRLTGEPVKDWYAKLSKQKVK